MNYRLLEENSLAEGLPTLRPQVSIHTSLVQTLNEMGFSSEFIEIAIAYTSSYNIDELLAFMIKGERGWEHEFIRNL